MRINHNIAALNTYRQLTAGTLAASKNMEKLSSGLRINRAGDDAAGLAISEKMRAQIRGLEQATRNAQDGISMIQTAEGALNEVHSILQRMRELSVQASNDTNTADDREAIGDELVQLKEEIDRISRTTSFNGKGLLNGDLSTSLDTASSNIKVGATFDNTSVSQVVVSGAKAGEIYALSYNDATKQLTLTRGSDNVSQTINLSAVTPKGDAKTLSFNELGISFTLTGTATSTDDLGAALNGKKIVTATGNASAEFLIGSNGTNDEKLTVDFIKIDSTTLGSSGGNNLANLITDNTAVNTVAKADALIKVIDDAIKQVSSQRSALGAAQNRLEHTINNLGTASENLTAAESRIRDVDYALAA
ncbi:Flagellin [Geobacillus thermodenitrificans]|uniref:flagellin N-terminal helical domain-containing protein n=1 Tax=Geobacillus thermodenitrificans TaxID=33940 RepID=UPI000A29668D|nr:flagellin [Geobacillus thermodenitrificans]ARP44123.1 Flagellin [Geobacillus thermodenitrificans]